MKTIKFRIKADNPNKFLYYEFIPTMGFILKGAKLEDRIEIGEKYAQQFTGLKDSFENDLYEGDIITYDVKINSNGLVQKNLGQILWSDFWGAWGVGKKEVWNLFSDHGIINIVKIGNIIENPDKLDVKV